MEGPGSARESTERIGAAANRTLGDDDDADSWRELARGESIGRYVVIARIGAGGMGVVFAAYDPDLDRKIAIKLLSRPERGGVPRMMREAQAIAKVVHPNVVAVHDVGMHGDRMYVAMEFVDGENLATWLERPHTLRETLDVLGQAGRGLQAAHDVGLVHRDFKPDNVLVGRDGRARVADFGLARAVTTRDPTPDGDGRIGHGNSTEIRLTQTGALVGTPAYMAPEQHLRLDTDARSDQFAFCVTAWEALFGVRPYTADSLVVLSVRVTEGRIDPPPPDNRVPGRIKAALLRGLSPLPTDRWPSMTALLERLGDDSGRRRRFALAGGLVVVGTTVGFAAAAGLRDRDTACDPDRTAMATVWDDEARAAVDAAFRATEVPFAPDVLRTVEDRLDDARDRWAAEYVAACEATHVRGDQSPALLDRRMACLDERRRELVAVVDVLRDADATVVQRGVETVAGLVPVDRCADVEALQRDEAIPPPELTEAVADVRAELQAALALDRAGRPQIADARIQTVVARIEEIGWRPLRVELEVARQRLMRDDATADVEIGRLVVAYNEALALGDDTAAAELANALGWEWGYRNRDLTRGLEWIATARALLERIDADWLLQVRVLNGEATVRSTGRDLDGAAPLFEQAVALADEHDPGGLRAIQLRANLAAFHAERGDYPRAIELLEETRAGYERLLGPSHPRLGDVYGNLASAWMMLGDLDRAAEAFAHADTIFAAAVPATHVQRARVLGGQAIIERIRGHRDRAIELNRQVLALHEQRGDEIEIMRSCFNLGTALLDDDAVGAATLAEVDELGVRAIAIAERRAAAADGIPAWILRVEVAQRRDDAAAARRLLAGALAVAEDPAVPPGDRLGVRTLAVDVALQFGSPAEVKSAIDAAEPVLETAPEQLSTATQLFALAKARWRVDHGRVHAVVLAERAERLLAKRNDRTGRLDDVRAWLREHRAAATP